MINGLKYYSKLIGVILAAAAIIIGIGYLFAEKKSEPVYLSKIDKLMFDNDNKAPRYILTLPDYQSGKNNADAQKGNEQKDTAVIEETPPAEQPLPEAPKALTMDDVLSTVPSLTKLGAKEPTQTLKYIELSDNLTENNGTLKLPRAADNGKKPWIEYGKMVRVNPNFRKVAIVIKGLGFDENALGLINKGFNSEAAFSFSPYAQDSGKKIIAARQQGHETYVDMLLSSKDFLKSDSGPMSMSLTISSDESIERLRKSLSTGAPLGGVVVNDGVADESNAEVLKKLMEELKNRGLVMIDATHGDGLDKIKADGLPRKKADFVIDYLYDRKLIKETLQAAEKIALDKGQVLIVVEPKPVILTTVNEWINTFSPQVDYETAKNIEIKKPLALVPVSNLVVE